MIQLHKDTIRWCVPAFDAASDAQEKNMENGSSFEKHSPAIGAMFSISGAPLVTPHTTNISGYSARDERHRDGDAALYSGNQSRVKIVRMFGVSFRFSATIAPTRAER
jgi:hypothetical protein